MDAVNMTPGHADTGGKHSEILYPLMLISAIAVIVFSVAGIATMLGWMPGAHSSDAGPARAQTVPASKLVQSRVVIAAIDCQECGVVESMRAVEKSINYEIRVRMNDGTYRTLFERARPALTIGQKVRVTDHGVIAAG